MWDAIWLAVGLVFILEGVGPLLFPNRWANYIQQIAAEGPTVLRRIGGVLVVIGVVMVLNFF